MYRQIDSYSNEKILLPGYNYKLSITLLSDLQINIQKLISIIIFSSTSPNSAFNEIIVVVAFNLINKLPLHNEVNQYN